MPVSVRELLDCLAVLESRLAYADMDQFYFLSRMSLVKDEKYFDRFDRAFEDFFVGLDEDEGVFEEQEMTSVLNDLLAVHFPKLSLKQKADAFDEYRELVAEKKRLATDAGAKERQPQSGLSDASGDVSGDRKSEQGSDQEQPRAEVNDAAANDEEPRAEGQDGADDVAQSGEDSEQGESGDGGDEGHEGENGEKGEKGEDGEEGEGINGVKGLGAGEKPGTGIRDDIDLEAQRSASKVWQLRQFEDYDPDVELGTRNLKMALRRLRKFARTGADLELDLQDTIRCTARNAGMLEIIEVPERRNNIKVLLFLDVGGSMDDHIELCSQLFAAAKTEFKYLDYYYFHNFVYETLWSSNERREEERLNTFDLIHKFGSDYKIIFVGDANMARHEIAERGGSVEHFNAESGEVWLERIQDQFKKIVWLNPVAPKYWQDSYSVTMIHRLLEEKMYHLSVEGIEQAMKYLGR